MGLFLRQNYTAYTTVRCEISLKVAAGQLMSSVDTHNIPRKLLILADIFAVEPRKWKTIIWKIQTPNLVNAVNIVVEF